MYGKRDYGNIKKYITQKRGEESKRESNYDNSIVEFLQTSMTSLTIVSQLVIW